MMNERSMEELLHLARKAGFILCQILVMKKQNKVVNPYFFRQCEFVIVFRKGGYKKLNKQGTSNVFEVQLKKGKDKVHPTQKPVNFLKELIINCSNENDLILDPFAGSGSTLKAAKLTNRRYLGFEIDETFFINAIKNM
jgi:site-specific DNA-methyltransferase (adenine-specific)